MTDLETRVGLAMHARSDQLAAPDDLGIRVLARARTVRLRRRIAVGAVAVATAGVVAVITAQAIPSAIDQQPEVTPTIGTPSVDPTEPPAQPTESATPLDESDELASWLASLPTGDAAQLPYTTQTELIDGSTRVALPVTANPVGDPEVFSVVSRIGTDESDRAWILQGSVPSGDGGAPTRVGRLDQAGGFVELVLMPTAGFAGISPDHSMLATSPARFMPGEPITIVSATDGAEVAVVSLGPDEHLVGWAASGLVVVDTPVTGVGGTVRLVQLDGTSEPVTATDATVLDPSGDLATLLDADGCYRVVELAAPADARATFCDGSGLVSPDGRWRVGTDRADNEPSSPGSVLDLDSGATSQLPIPDVTERFGAIAWESTENVLFWVSIMDDDGPIGEAVVRCSVTELRCEIALPLGGPYVFRTF